MDRASNHIRHNLWGIVAVFIALSGTAAALPGKNQVDSGDIKKAQVKNSDLANGAVTNPKLAADAVDGTKVADNSLKGADVDEASLDIPQQALPTTLPPSGAAGGDLAGTYPNPQVQEAGLTAGGDVTGALNATSIANNSIGGNETGVAEDEIADGGVDSQDVQNESIGNADIDDADTEYFIPAGTIAANAVGGAGQPQYGTISSFPAIMFDPNTDETLTLAIPVPTTNAGPGHFVGLSYNFSSTGSGTVSWQHSFAAVTPQSADTLSGASAFASATTPAPVTAQEVETFGTGQTANNFAGPRDLLRLQIVRDANAGADTLTADAALLGMTVTFTNER